MFSAVVSQNTIPTHIAEQSLGDIFNQVIAGIRQLQYSTTISNLILVIFAIGVITVGLFAGWLALHPDKPRSFLLIWKEKVLSTKFGKKYQRLIEFVAKRFSSHGAFGLSFTIGLLILTVSIVLFGNLLEEVTIKNEIIPFDVPLLSYIAAHRIAWLTALMRSITMLGNEWLIAGIALISSCYFRIKVKSWRPAIVIIMTVLGAGLLDLLFKTIVARPRPLAFMIIDNVAGYGFPSGHAAMTALYGTLAFLFAKTRKTWEGKIFPWAAALAVSFAVGISRIYLGVHWPTDVLGGWVLALLWLSLLFTTATIIENIRGGVYSVTGIIKEKKSSSIISTINTALLKFRRIFITDLRGLSQAEVDKRIAQGLTNATSQRTSRSFRHILASNLFTRFNAILGTLFILILIIGSPKDALFGLVIVLNTSIGIIQEIRAKWALDRLSLISTVKVNIIRDGTKILLPTRHIVSDDLIELHTGDQIPVDGVLLKSDHFEVDESLITGESDHIIKQISDNVYSGSFVTAGKGYIQALQVGEQAYARRLANAARQFSLSQSELRRGINQILKYVIWFLVPAGILLFTTQLLFTRIGWRDAVSGSVAGISEMIPDGLVLLTSTVMALAVIRLARQKALIQELSAVEIMARVDVLCLDKTGTLTEGSMEVESIIPIERAQKNALPPEREIMGIFAEAQEPSATLTAIAAACPPPPPGQYTITDNIPFSSARKWSAITLKDNGSWILGGPEMILSQKKSTLMDQINSFAEQGKRVMILAYTRDTIPNKTPNTHIDLPRLHPHALIILKEKIRPDVARTLEYFAAQEVAIKIISGDNPRTVAAVAAAAGVQNIKVQNSPDIPDDPAAVRNIIEKNNVFGRTTPKQKKQMVEALRDHGHVVAMIGDGVNDILAIKAADFGIAMGSGTGSNRAIAQLILLQNNFSILPSVIAEGRRIIANIERTANLFITKTSYVLAMVLAVGIAQVPFPYLPRQLTLIGFFTIGCPALFLSLAPNTTRAKSGFVPRVLRFSIPSGTMVAAIILVVYALVRQLEPSNIELARTTATLTLLGCGFSVLWLLARPKTLWHRIFVAALIILLGIVIIHPISRNFFALVTPPVYIWAVILIFSTACFLGIKKLSTKAVQTAQ